MSDVEVLLPYVGAVGQSVPVVEECRVVDLAIEVLRLEAELQRPPSGEVWQQQVRRFAA